MLRLMCGIFSEVSPEYESIIMCCVYDVRKFYKSILLILLSVLSGHIYIRMCCIQYVGLNLFKEYSSLFFYYIGVKLGFSLLFRVLFCSLDRDILSGIFMRNSTVCLQLCRFPINRIT